MQFTKEQLTRIIESADDVITALAGTNEDCHQESDGMIRLWDYLNDVAAPPAIVKKLAEMALAGMEAEPVAARYRHHNGLAPSIWKYVDSVEECNSAPNYQCQALYAAPLPLTTSERAELENYRNAQQVVPSDGRDQFEEWFKFHHGEEHSIVTLHRANGGLNYRDPHVDLAWIAWKDSRAAMQSDAVKDGWVMVPREATSEMINSAMRDNETGEVAEIYELMIAAAPKQD